MRPKKQQSRSEHNPLNAFNDPAKFASFRDQVLITELTVLKNLLDCLYPLISCQIFATSPPFQEFRLSFVNPVYPKKFSWGAQFFETKPA
jgi:hypothetical protein